MQRGKLTKKKKKILYQKANEYVQLFGYLRERAAVGGIVILIAVIVGLGISIVHVQSQEKPYVPELPSNDMTKIPPEVKQAAPHLATTSATLHVPILMYHYIEIVQDKSDTERQALDIVPSVLDEQIQTLQKAGYTFVTPKDLADYMDGLAQEPKNPIILSFDDGYRDFYTDAFPILKKYHAKAISYVIPGFLDTPNYMFTWQLHEVASSGLVEIGAHTMHHPSLSGMSLSQATYEIDESKKELENELHIPVVSFAYPYGSFDLQAIQIVKDAGFRTAVSTIPGVEENETDRFYMYRIRPGYRVGDELLMFLKQTSFQPW